MKACLASHAADAFSLSQIRGQLLKFALAGKLDEVKGCNAVGITRQSD